MTGRVILQGDLSAIHLPDVLTFISMVRPTGKLLLTQDALERTIFWTQGEIVFASSNSPEHSLGRFLLQNGKITQQEYEESIDRVTKETRHGKLLVQMGVLSPKDLWWGVKHHVLEIIYSLFEWKQGRFEFTESSEELHERITLSATTSSIIMEGIRRIDEGIRIREKIPNLDMIFARVPEGEPTIGDLDMNPVEMALFNRIDGVSSVRDLIRQSELTEFEVTRILFQLLSARLIETAQPSAAKGTQPVFLDVEDSPELLKVISTYNSMFGRLYDALEASVGSNHAREIFASALQTSDTSEVWAGVLFGGDGRFDENMLLANVCELPLEERKPVLDEGLNTLLSIQLFEVSQHLDATTKVEVFRFISDQKAQLEL